MSDDFDEDLTPYSAFGRPLIELLLLSLIDGQAAALKAKADDAEQSKEKAKIKAKLKKFEETARLARLDQAMLAITGQKASLQPNDEGLYERGLRLMAEAEYKDEVAEFDYHWRKRRGEEVPAKPPKVRKPLALAKMAEEQIFGTRDWKDQKTTRIDNLRKMYTGSYQKKLKNGSEIHHRSTLTHRVREQDYTLESVEWAALQEIAEAIKKAGVPIVLKK
ncbi:hypothetical protein [Silicimonas sp. MF1-12-2]|uniref:hypothetical protein n=1 Tax=Silicimonas sp. MF1-12-2 TaxID=3384793 RepID=UPI0039B4E51E